MKTLHFGNAAQPPPRTKLSTVPAVTQSRSSFVLIRSAARRSIKHVRVATSVKTAKTHPERAKPRSDSRFSNMYGWLQLVLFSVRSPQCLCVCAFVFCLLLSCHVTVKVADDRYCLLGREFLWNMSRRKQSNPKPLKSRWFVFVIYVFWKKSVCRFDKFWSLEAQNSPPISVIEEDTRLTYLFVFVLMCFVRNPSCWL